MSGPRLIGTTVAMAVVGGVLRALTPPVPEMARTLAGAQRTVDTVGVDVLVTAATGLAAWVVWAWGILGLLLTAASAVPGTVGRGAELLTRVLLPAGARRAAALALGVGLGVAAPLGSAATLLVVTAPAALAETAPGVVPDWPAAPAPPPTEPPAPPAPAPAPAPGEHVVVRGDCLWDIAESRLTSQLGRAPAPLEIADAVHAWWSANADVIGADPDLLLPGQVLRPPA